LIKRFNLSGLVCVQVLGVIVWLFIEPPSVQVIHPTREVAVQTCGASSFSLMISLAYNMVLIFLCTWYAFKTRKIPENFNEAKYIGFTMYSTCIIWLAFIPIFFGTKNDYEVSTYFRSHSHFSTISIGVG
jgi:metabotropic glutamate receptor 6/7/8